MALGGCISQPQFTHKVLHSFIVIVFGIFIKTKSSTPTVVLKMMLHWHVALLFASLFDKEAEAVNV